MMGVQRDQIRDPSPLRRRTASDGRHVRQKRQKRLVLEVVRHAVGVVTIFADKRIRIGMGEPRGFPPPAPEPVEHVQLLSRQRKIPRELEHIAGKKIPCAPRGQ